MKVLKFIFITSFFIAMFCTLPSPGQTKSDSLRFRINAAKNDTEQVKYMVMLADELRSVDPDSSVYFATKALAISQKAGWQTGIADAENNLGMNCFLRSEYKDGLKHFYDALEILQRVFPPNGGERGASVMANIALLLTDQGNYAKALEYHLSALKTFENLSNKEAVSRSYMAIGLIYDNQGDVEKALDYYQKALKLKVELKDEGGIAYAKTSLGNIYWELADNSTALNYYNQALSIIKNGGSKLPLGTLYGNIANIYKAKAYSGTDSVGFRHKFYSKALCYYSLAEKCFNEIGNKYFLSTTYFNIGELHFMKHEYKTAQKFITSSIELAKEVQDLDGMADSYKKLSQTDSALGNNEAALEDYKTYVSLRDSINNEEGIKKQTQLEMQFEFDKKQTADSVRVAEEKKVSAAELETEKNQSYTLYGGLALVLIFAAFMYNRFSITRKQKKIIENQKNIVEEQKKLVEEKQREVLDSINYARRIQMALIPNEKIILNALKKSKKG